MGGVPRPMPQAGAPAPMPDAGMPRSVRVLWIAAILAVIIVGLGVAYLKTAGANVDYICTKVVQSESACGNGSWGTWTVVSTNTASNVKTTIQKRVYTGTRTISQTLQYLSRRMQCAAGYDVTGTSSSGGDSGFHDGTITTTSSACQIEQSQTVVTTMTPTGTKVSLTNDNTKTDLGEASSTSKAAQSLAELEGTVSTGTVLAGPAEGSIEAKPSIVSSGSTSKVSWSATGVASCSVSGTNGDAWTGATGSSTTKPIIQKTTYTLRCVATDEEVLTATADVNVIPKYQEQ